MEPVTTIHIETAPGQCGGKPCIKGTRIRVWDIYVASELRGESPDEILLQYPSISLADVHAALAYYWDNRDAIDQQMKEADERIEALKNMTGPGPLAKQLTSLDAGSDSVSS